MAESFAAFGAFEWFFFRVDVSMISQMILPSKSLLTNITGIRSFIGMRTFVYEQIVRLAELAITEFTNELFLRPRRSSRCPEQSSVSSPGRWENRRTGTRKRKQGRISSGRKHIRGTVCGRVQNRRRWRWS